MRMKGSWKTTAAGIFAILGGLGTILHGVLTEEPTQWEVALTSIASGIGLLCARDNNRSSEDVGVQRRGNGPPPPQHANCRCVPPVDDRTEALCGIGDTDDVDTPDADSLNRGV